MKFDIAIGNPAYQEENEYNERKSPVYNYFMDESIKIADCVELITPARFLFNAGQTPKAWNEKMLNDPHFKVIYFEPNAEKVFPNTDIKGGVAITYHHNKRNFGAIGTFTYYLELNTIVHKVNHFLETHKSVGSIIASQGLFRFSDKFFADNPDATHVIGKGTGNKIVSNVMGKIPNAFLDVCPKNGNYVRFLGRESNRRVYKYIRRDYLIENDYIDGFKLFIPEANNSGKFGETLTEPTLGCPGDGSSDTFLNAGPFATEIEVQNLGKYIKTKFFRALLGVKKATQHCPPEVWKIIPLQNFSNNSDIDWNVSIINIDRQLYKKYGLSPEEIEFIETHVKEMK